MRTRYANTAKSKAPRTGEDIRTFSERKLTEAEIREVDEKLARFCYSEGLRELSRLKQADLAPDHTRSPPFTAVHRRRRSATRP